MGCVLEAELWLSRGRLRLNQQRRHSCVYKPASSPGFLPEMRTQGPAAPLEWATISFALLLLQDSPLSFLQPPQAF